MRFLAHLVALAAVPSLLAAETARADQACPITVMGFSADIPDDLPNQASSGRLRATIRNDSIVPLMSIEFTATFAVSIPTVSGSRSERKSFKFDHGRVALLPGMEEAAEFGLEDLTPYASAKLDTLVVGSAYLYGGAICKDGRLTKDEPCTLAVDRKIIASNLDELICALDVTLSDDGKKAQAEALRHRLQGMLRKQPLLCPDREAEAYVRTADPKALRPVLERAIVKCPGIIGSLASSNEFWPHWPCPDCFLACTGLSREEAQSENVPLDAIAQFRGCIAHCSTGCNEARTKEVANLIESDRRYNWAPKSGPRPEPITELYGVRLDIPAGEALANFAARPNDKIDARCGKGGVQCFDLEWTGGKGRPPVEKPSQEDKRGSAAAMRAAIKDKKIVMLSFNLEYDEYSNPEDWSRYLERKHGEPRARYYLMDKKIEQSAMAEERRPVDDLLLGIWSAIDGEVHANANDYTSSYNESRHPELIYVRTPEWAPASR